jgi:diguanylate cyclase (GGDEF)-like protein/PAS domain S-box-containing protein
MKTDPRQDKARAELIEELGDLRRRLAEIERTRSEDQNVLQALYASEEKYRVLVDESGDPIFAFDPGGRYRYANRAFAEGVGKRPEEIIGHTVWDVFPQGEADKRFAVIRAVFASGAGQVLDVRVPRPEGDRYYVTTLRPTFDVPGRVASVICTSKDITERIRMEEALREGEKRYRTLIEWTPEPVAVHRGGKLIYANPAALKMVGAKSPADLIGKSPLELIHPDYHGIVLERMKKTAATGIAMPRIEEKFLTLDGRTLDVEIQNIQIVYDGQPAVQVSMRDVTERNLAERQLRVAAAIFESQEGMVVTDAKGLILRVNTAFTEITGFSATEVVGQNPRLLRSGRHDAAFYAEMWQSIESTGSWRGEIWNRRKSGEVYPEWLTISTVRDVSGEVANYVATLTDITLRKTAEVEINNLAFYDTLTSLPNRRLLLDRLHQALAASVRSGRFGALLFLDLDNFKALNDTLGHDIGDLLLQRVAERLASCVREGDTVARLGGDEFVVMLEDLSEGLEEAATHTEIVGGKILAALNEPYQLGNYEHRSTPSIGITLFADGHGSIDELLKRADLAMYQAKAAGRNTLRFFDPEMQAVVTARVTLEAALREAVLKDQFLLYYQAQVDGDGRLTGVEVLLRWQHPQRGLVPPLEFIWLAEETGVIQAVGSWVLETACTKLAEWANRPKMAHLMIAVNVSAKQFHQKDFVDQVLAVLERTGADPHRLKLELTESLLVEDVEEVIKKMVALREKGVSFSLDDFGTGYSSLSYLRRLPLDQLKIDQSFVRDVLTDHNDAAIARTVVALGQSLGLAVIAEGVETEAQRDFLTSHGCLAYQGFLFSRPLPLEAFEEFAARV